jgi:hypothetical protein
MQIEMDFHNTFCSVFRFGSLADVRYVASMFVLPRKRTSQSAIATSALCHFQTKCSAANSGLFDHLVGRRPGMVKQRDFRGHSGLRGQAGRLVAVLQPHVDAIHSVAPNIGNLEPSSGAT